ncbi:hypothetical protein Hypma_003054 [Hypsizygus marmoreus]|uniref:Uncharacterized protein n=1 Tax=Hypsizygus marmoreus TaxID=39966 RepID=A0A369J6W9_HYPMA|nr:hypothetical protein Hypma_003054 [Hypsizygus marmoreus]
MLFFLLQNNGFCGSDLCNNRARLGVRCLPTITLAKSDILPERWLLFPFKRICRFCLDSGSKDLGNGVGTKIWQCYDSLPVQAWPLAEDKRLVRCGASQCLALLSR